MEKKKDVVKYQRPNMRIGENRLDLVMARALVCVLRDLSTTWTSLATTVYNSLSDIHEPLN